MYVFGCSVFYQTSYLFKNNRLKIPAANFRVMSSNRESIGRKPKAIHPIISIMSMIWLSCIGNKLLAKIVARQIDIVYN